MLASAPRVLVPAPSPGRAAYRAAVLRHVPPVARGGEAAAHHHRRAVRHHDADAEHAASRVVQRQRVVDDVLRQHGEHVHDPGREEHEPAANPPPEPGLEGRGRHQRGEMLLQHAPPAPGGAPSGLPGVRERPWALEGFRGRL